MAVGDLPVLSPLILVLWEKGANTETARPIVQAGRFDAPLVVRGGYGAPDEADVVVDADGVALRPVPVLLQ